ncbi:hypothetical protein [Henriciella sp.]|uniref:hypothetical protein n=1 Tax=Henriciella sp. TaxID=1968823 RepID=UPI00260C5F94|nr:hypothetical protein [Henriciella sp.]
MASALDICNAALAHIGQRRIVASIDPPEQSVEAEYCALFWPLVRDETLASHTWSFATARVTLADLSASAPPPSAFTYTYALPAECLKFIAVRESMAEDDTVNKNCRLGMADDGRAVIYTNVETAVGVYVSSAARVANYPPLMVWAQEFMLASRLATPIVKGTEGMRLSDSLLQKGVAYLEQARMADANQSRQRGVTDPTDYKASWLNVRGVEEPDLPRIIRE